MREPTLCPCSSGAAFASCCRPHVVGGVAAPTPEALMRSRYAAFATKQVDYLVRTLHPDHPDASRPVDAVRGELKKVCNRLAYPALAVLATEPDDASGDAWVVFRATVKDGGHDVSFTERSRFRRHDGAWRYVDGDVVR